MGFVPFVLVAMPNLLPESVQQVAEVIGVDAALDLVRRWPRTRTNGDVPFRPVMYVPARLTPDHRLVSILGWNKAEALVRIFGGEIIFLATCASVRRRDRDEAIAAAVAGNASPAAIATMTGMTERHVRRIIARVRADMSAMGKAGVRNDHPREPVKAFAA